MLKGSIRLRCLECQSHDLQDSAAGVRCLSCDASYPVVAGVPVFIRATGTLFSAATAADVTKSGFIARRFRSLGRFLPGTTFTHYAARAKKRAIDQFRGTDKRCLVIGSGDNIEENAALCAAFGCIVASDVSVHTGVDTVCDGHDLPFANDQFDFVMLTAVLEHVLNPERVVSEVARVLKQGGGLYAVTPFMQQVHMGCFDFQRYTDLGHRWLFRNFEQVERGTCGGPASSLVWALVYFFSAFGYTRRSVRALGYVARICFFWLKYLDLFLERKAAGRDGANGFYFVGRNLKRPALNERQLLLEYVGRNR